MHTTKVRDLIAQAEKYKETDAFYPRADLALIGIYINREE